MARRKMPAAHILSYARTLEGGGVERALLRLAGEWIDAGRRVTLVLGSAVGPLGAELPGGIEVIELGSARQLALSALPRVVAAQRPDVIFCPGSHYTSVAAWTRMRLGAACPPIVGKLSNALARGDHDAILAGAHRAWLAQHPRFLDRIVAMTPATARAAIAALRIAPDRVATIPNPPPRASVRGASPDLPADLPPRYLLGVGRLARQKRWDRLIVALPRLADRAIPLVILGEGEARAALGAQARALGIAARVTMPGYAADPAAAIAGATLLALTSDFEGVPGVLREALAAGTPVVATDCSPAVAEIVSDPRHGTIVPRDDSAALVAALDRWLAPGAPRFAPVPPPGADSAARYLALFDTLVSG